MPAFEDEVLKKLETINTNITSMQKDIASTKRDVTLLTKKVSNLEEVTLRTALGKKYGSGFESRVVIRSAGDTVMFFRDLEIIKRGNTLASIKGLIRTILVSSYLSYLYQNNLRMRARAFYRSHAGFNVSYLTPRTNCLVY